MWIPKVFSRRKALTAGGLLLPIRTDWMSTECPITWPIRTQIGSTKYSTPDIRRNTTSLSPAARRKWSICSLWAISTIRESWTAGTSIQVRRKSISVPIWKPRLWNGWPSVPAFTDKSKITGWQTSAMDSSISTRLLRAYIRANRTTGDVPHWQVKNLPMPIISSGRWRELPVSIPYGVSTLQSTELSLLIKVSTSKVHSTIHRHLLTSLPIAARMVIGTTWPTNVSAKAHWRTLPLPIQARAPGVRVPKYWYAIKPPSRKTTIWAHYSDIPHRNITARALPFPVKELLTGHWTNWAPMKLSSALPARHLPSGDCSLTSAVSTTDIKDVISSKPTFVPMPPPVSVWTSVGGISLRSPVDGVSRKNRSCKEHRTISPTWNCVFPGERQVTILRATTTGRQTTPQVMS